MRTETALPPASSVFGLEALAPAVFSADRSGRWTALNVVARVMLPGGTDGRDGFSWLRAVFPADRGAVLDAWRKLRAGAVRTRVEFRLRRSDGSAPWYLAEVQATDGEPAFAAVVTDIGFLKQREAALQAQLATAAAELQGRSDFLAGLSHDLRSPLNAVIGLTESLVETGAPFDPVRTDKYLKLVNASGRQLLGQLNEVIDLVRLDAGRTVPNRSAVDIGSAVRALGETARKAGAAKGVDVVVDRPAGPLVIATDERLLWQVLQILLHNAVKFTPASGRVTLTAAAGAAGTVRIEVRDTGAGMSAEKTARLFAPHVPGSAGKRTGPGVGLTLVGRIVPLLGGRISVASTPGAGSVFAFELPPA